MDGQLFADEAGYLGERGMIVHRDTRIGGRSWCGVRLYAKAPDDWAARTDPWDYRPCVRCWSATATIVVLRPRGDVL